MNNLSNKKNLLLDLDGTVYQDLESVFGQVSKLMTKYISEKLNIDLKKAKELQTNYFYKYNTSLNGLMIHHDIPPKEFLKYNIIFIISINNRFNLRLQENCFPHGNPS